MKILSLSLLFTFVILGACSKSNKQENCITFLTIGEVITPSVSTLSAGITSSIKAYGPNLCYSFKDVEIHQSGEKIFDIKVRANIPCRPTVCLEAIYKTSTSIKINTPATGTYILRFYNNNLVFKSDTVVVN